MATELARNCNKYECPICHRIEGRWKGEFWARSHRCHECGYGPLKRVIGRGAKAPIPDALDVARTAEKAARKARANHKFNVPETAAGI